MTQERVERLEALLSRVQENRKRSRTPAGLGAPRPEVARALAVEPNKPEPVRPAPAAPPPEAARPVAARPGAAPPQAAPIRTAPPPPAPTQPRPPVAPARPAPVARPAARAGIPDAGAARRPGQDRGATPLEMAVAELDLAKPAAAKPEPLRREQAAPTAPVAPPEFPPEEILEPRVIEPEPIREAGRPIAQVMSRHSPQVDATFGAMLKRSLTLRPH